jgi:ABC-type bacteriocin/lantibiotic exporter with double-glycine peptidase domain
LRDFALSEELRPDIKVNGLESWLPSQQRQAFLALGDTSTKPFWKNQAKDTISFVQKVSNNLLLWAENCWFLYEGLYNGISLGTLELIRSSANDLFEHIWDLSSAADDAVEEWKNIISFFKCEELKPEIRATEDCLPYVRNPAGMKVEAREIRYKYDENDENEVLKGASFIINPGAMVVVVGYSPSVVFADLAQMERGSQRLQDY